MKRLLLSIAAVVALVGPTTAMAQDPVTAAAPVARRDTTISLDALIALVGTVPITRYDLEQRLVDTVQGLLRARRPLPGEAERRAIVLAKLTELVDEEVLLNRAKEQDIDIPDAEVTAAAEQQMKTVAASYANDDAGFRRDLQRSGFNSPEEYRRFWSASYRRNRVISTLVHKLIQEKKLPIVNIPESDILAQFNKVRDAGGAHGRPATVLWRQMVIAPAPSVAAKAAAKAKIDSLRLELVAGGDFERIAKRETMDAASKESGGDIGWRRRGDLPEAIEKVAFDRFFLRPGEISQVIESPYGFHIIRIDRVNAPLEVKLRQILIIPKIDSTDVVRAQRLADSLVAAIRRGAPFDTVARRFHDLAEDPPGLMNETPRDSLPTYYQTGLKDVAKDSVVAFPIPTAAGSQKFVIAQVVSTTDAGDYTYDMVKKNIRDDMTQRAQMRKYIDAQRQPVYVKVYEDRALQAATIFDRAPRGG